MESNVRREFKNSVFIDVFGQDAYRLELFQTLHPEMPDVTAADIQTITLKQVITNHQYNDLAFLVRDRLMIFVEAQATWSVNILVRTLLYLADTIQEYLHIRGYDIHDSKKLSLPRPEFYIIYTGSQQVPESVSLREHFFGDPALPLDISARVFTAETTDIIGQYIIFCHVLDEQILRLGRGKDAAVEAIRICRDRGVLASYLREQEKEVVDIMVMLFDQEYAVKQFGIAQRQEGRREGLQEGMEKGLLKGMINLVKRGLLSAKDGAEQAGISLEEFEALLAQT